MTKNSSLQFFPGNTITLADSYVVNEGSETIAAMFELDLTDVHKYLKQLRKDGQNVALSAWIVKLITNSLSDQVLDEYPKNLNYEMWLEKNFDNRLYSVPVNVNDVSQKSMEDISKEIGLAKGAISKERNFLKQNKKRNAFRHMLYLPMQLRKLIWRFLLRNPNKAYRSMGNGAFSYISTTGKYVPYTADKAVNSISMAISSMFQKPRIINHELKMRNIVPITLLLNRKMMCNRDANNFVNDLKGHINNNAAFVCQN